VPTLAIEEVGRTFPVCAGTPTRAIEPTSLRIADNDFICLLGPSVAASRRSCASWRLDRPTTGRVLLDGEPVTGPGAERGMVFQSYTLFPWLTVAENIGFGLREKGTAPPSAGASSGTISSGGLALRAPLSRMLSAGCSSGPRWPGPRQRSEGAPARRAFGALDNQTRALMQELLLGIWEADRKTVLFVTHDIDEAIFIGNRVAVMTARPGRIKSDIAIDLSHPRHYTVKTTRSSPRTRRASPRRSASSPSARSRWGHSPSPCLSPEGRGSLLYPSPQWGRGQGEGSGVTALW